VAEYFSETGIQEIAVQYFQEIHQAFAQRQVLEANLLLDSILGKDLRDKMGQYDLADIVHILDKYPHGLLVLYHYVLEV
jgi:hypothetical protein